MGPSHVRVMVLGGVERPDQAVGLARLLHLRDAFQRYRSFFERLLAT
jgi:hypothetical protein